jgi:hypothetical protein
MVTIGINVRNRIVCRGVGCEGNRGTESISASINVHIRLMCHPDEPWKPAIPSLNREESFAMKLGGDNDVEPVTM